MGHEFAGDIVKVGKAHQDKCKPGMKFTLQPACLLYTSDAADEF